MNILPASSCTDIDFTILLLLRPLAFITLTSVVFISLALVTFYILPLVHWWVPPSGGCPW